MSILVVATPIGLALDIVGFVLLIRYGHALFITVSGGPPSGSKGSDNVLHIQTSESSGRENSRERFRARIGVVMVIFGFGLQLLGSIAVISLDL